MGLQEAMSLQQTGVCQTGLQEMGVQQTGLQQTGSQQACWQGEVQQGWQLDCWQHKSGRSCCGLAGAGSSIHSSQGHRGRVRRRAGVQQLEAQQGARSSSLDSRPPAGGAGVGVTGPGAADPAAVAQVTGADRQGGEEAMAVAVGLEEVRCECE